MANAHIIDNYADLPVGLYMEILATSRADMEDIDKQVRIISLLSGMPETQVLTLPIPDYKALAAATEFLTEPCQEGLVAKSYRLGGVELVPTSDLTKITAAQYIDFQTLSKGGDERTVELCSVFLVPKGCKYNVGYDIADVQDVIRRHLSVQDVVTLAAFFLRRYAELIVSSLTSCKRLIRRTKDAKKKAELEAKMAEAETALRRLTDSMTAGAGSLMSTL